MTFSSVAFVSGAHIDITGRLHVAANPGVSNPGHMEIQPGGAGLNMASTAAMLGLKTLLASPIGDDAHGMRLRAVLREREINDALAIIPEAATGTYTAIVEPDGQMVIGLADLAIYECINAQWFFHHCGAALKATDLWCLSTNLSSETIGEIAAKRNGRMLACVTISPAKSVRLRPVLGQTDLLFTNRREAQALTGLQQAEAPELVAVLRKAGVKSGTLSAGGDQLHYWHEEETGALQPPSPEAIADVNGAGDALAGTMLAGLSRGMTFGQCVRLAIAAAQMTLGTKEPVFRELSWQRLENYAQAIAPSNRRA